MWRAVKGAAFPEAGPGWTKVTKVRVTLGAIDPEEGIAAGFKVG